MNVGIKGPFRGQRETSRKFIYSFIGLAIILFIISLKFTPGSQVTRNGNEVFKNVLTGDLIRKIALFSFIIFFIYWEYGNKIKGNISNNRFISMVLIMAVFLAFNGLDFYSIVKDLKLGPVQISGTISDKKQVSLGRGATRSYIVLSGNNSFKVRDGKGFQRVRKSDRVEIWYGKYTKEAFLIEPY